ncbi:MAG TPA: hypothetical protein VN598_14580, partial [Usitatibacter sp.]|nr:hypothetical protein [Usitatibacter sp.]
MDLIINNWMWVFVAVAVIVLLALCRRVVLWLAGVILVPDDSIGVVTKKWTVGARRKLPPGRIVALNGEAGYQADTLAPGMHGALWPWQYRVELVKFCVIPADSVGLVQACDGRALPSGHIIAKQVACDTFQDARAFLEGGGERGPQMAVIPPGSYRVNPLLFTVKAAPVVSIPPGQIGVVEARDGRPLEQGRIIARSVHCDSFQDGAAFIAGGGERGPQMAVIAAGTYRINTMLFDVRLAPVVDVLENKVGIVTTREGKALAQGEIAGPVVPDHDMFQDPGAFLANGGCKGLQEQVLLAGRYFINPRFATIEVVDMVDVPIAHVGVVIAYVGREGRDVTGEAFRHGNLVSKGERGVW